MGEKRNQKDEDYYIFNSFDHSLSDRDLLLQEIHQINQSKVRDVLEETLMEEDVVHQRIHVTMERETVMDLLMVELMMDMLVAREILCVAATIVRSLATTTMRRMTAAIFQRLFRTHLLSHKLLLMLL